MELAYGQCAADACRLRRHRGGLTAAGLAKEEWIEGAFIYRLSGVVPVRDQT